MKKELTIKDVFKKHKEGYSLSDSFAMICNEAYSKGIPFFIHKPKT